MSLWMFLKTFCDCCVCFAVLGAFPSLFPQPVSMFWPAVLCSLGAGAAAWFCDRGKREFRFFAFFFPLSSLLTASSFAQGCVLLPAILYTFIIMIKSDMLPEYYSFRDYFRKSLIGLGIFFFVLWAFSYMEKASRPGYDSLDYFHVLTFSLLHAGAGVVLLRQLRLGLASLQDNRTTNAVQSIAIFGGLGAIALGCISFERFFRDDIEAFLNKLIIAILAPVAVLGNWTPDLDSPYEEPPVETTLSTESLPEELATFPTGMGLATSKPVVYEDSEPSVLIAVLIIVGLIIVMVLMFRTLRLQRVGSAGTATQVSRSEKKSSPLPARRTPRGKVRQYYRDFLAFEQRRGLKRTTNQTSLDILNQISADTDREAARQLREVYLKARYAPSAQITPEDAAEAKAALKKAKSGH